MRQEMELLAFYANPILLEEVDEAGVHGFIVDWENKGKRFRQSIYNTQVNQHRAEDLALVRTQTHKKLICRLNGPEFLTIPEIELAIDLGADELLIPMVTSSEEVCRILDQVKERVKVGVMLETEESLKQIRSLNQLPLCRFFVGLNDLSIQRKTRNLFQPIIDGTIEQLRPQISLAFGMAGLTHPDLGAPVPCRLLIREMKRYRCSFAFLRRSFYKDLAHFSARTIIKALKEEFSLENNFYALDGHLSEKEKEIMISALI